MLTGTCHCGALRWQFDHPPEGTTLCNCSVCRRYGVLWVYGYEGEGIALSGPSRAYLTGPRQIGFHFCPDCGCIAAWRAIRPRPDGRRRMAVNLRLADDYALIADIPVNRFDGHGAFADLPGDGRRVRDLLV